MATPISKTDLINRFTTRVKDYVTSQTNWISTTVVWNTNVGNVTSRSKTTYGGPYDRTTSANKIAEPAMISSDLKNSVSTAVDGANTIVSTLRNLLISYSNNHKITLRNTGNLSPPTHVGVAKLNDLLQTTKDQIIADVNLAASESNISKGKKITNLDIDGFIDDCKNIWINRCFTTPPEIFYYSFCHSSCHSNHGSHGSRGRR
jgi:hypothetical protein